MEMNQDNLRVLLTTLCCLRGAHLPLDPSLGSITSPGVDLDVSCYDASIRDFTKVLSRLPNKPKGLFRRGRIVVGEWKEYHLSTKSGPNGQALATCLDDLGAIPESLESSIATLGGPDLKFRMEQCRSNEAKLRDILKQPVLKRKLKFRKLTCIHSSEGKTRVIAIGDYFSQTCLKALHDVLYKVLKSIPSDQTFNQGEGLRELPLDGSRNYYSFDLSSATDRFPIALQERFLSYSIGQDKARA